MCEGAHVCVRGLRAVPPGNLLLTRSFTSELARLIWDKTATKVQQVAAVIVYIPARQCSL